MLHTEPVLDRTFVRVDLDLFLKILVYNPGMVTTDIDTLVHVFPTIRTTVS
ncbi:unnamed protein product, partial [Didymodactylos carnosus]